MSKRRRSYRTGSVYPRGGTWHIQYFVDGKRHRESANTRKKSEAEALLRKRLGEIATGVFKGLSAERVKISDLVKLVTEDYKFRSLRSLPEVEARANKHVLRISGECLAKRFGSEQVKSYVSLRRSEGAKPATINRELSIIRRGFTLACQSDPPLAVSSPHIPKLEEDNVRKGFLNYEQYSTLLDVLPEHLKAIFVCGYHVGNRAGELRALEPGQVDLEADVIRIRESQAKGKRPRTVPIYGDMHDYLKRQLDYNALYWPECPWVFNLNGRKLSKKLPGWKKACAKAGMPTLLFHDLRRSAIRNLRKAGVDRKRAKEISGHLTDAVFERYDITDEADLQESAAKAQSYLEKQRAKSETRKATEKPQSEGYTSSSPKLIVVK